jgi:hypothetical protein
MLPIVTRRGPAGAKVLESDDLSGMFGIEIAPTTPSTRAAASKITAKPRKPAPKRSASKAATDTSEATSGVGTHEEAPGSTKGTTEEEAEGVTARVAV